MQLYKTKSSAAATSAILSFAKSTLGGSSKAVVFVDGFNGKKCKTLRGTGKENDDSCTTTYNSICEFVDKGELKNSLK